MADNVIRLDDTIAAHEARMALVAMRGPHHGVQVQTGPPFAGLESAVAFLQAAGSGRYTLMAIRRGRSWRYMRLWLDGRGRRWMTTSPRGLCLILDRMQSRGAA